MKLKPLKFIVPGLVLLWGLYMVPLRSSGLDFSRIPGDLGDARFNNYVLEHGFRYLTGDEPDFWNAPFFYPETNTIAFSDNHIGNLPLYSALRASGLTREGAFQGWIITAFVLNFAACFYVLGRMGFGTAASSAGAYVFAFALPVAAQLNHIQLIPRYFVPAVFYCLWNYARWPRARHMVLAAVFVSLQFFLSIYSGWFVVLSGTVFLPVSWKIAGGKEVSTRRRVLHLECALALAAVLLVPLALPYLRVEGAGAGRPWSEIYSMLPRVSSFVYPAEGSLLWGWLGEERTFAYQHEHRIFPGLIPLAALLAAPPFYFLAGKRGSREKLAFACALSIILTFIITGRMSAGGVNIYRMLTSIPGVGAVRAVTRIMLVLLFPFSVPVAVFLDRLMKSARGKTAGMTILLPLLVFAVLADQGIGPLFSAHGRPWNSFPKRESIERADAVRNELFSVCPEPRVFVYMPGADESEPFWQVHLDAMFASQDSGVPTVNGYSGVFPDYYDLSMNFRDFWALDRWLAVSRRKMAGEGREAGDRDPFEGLVILGEPRGERGEMSFTEGPLPDEAFKAGIHPRRAEITGPAGGAAAVKVAVVNMSDYMWSAIGEPDGRYEFSLAWRPLPEKAGSERFRFRERIPYDVPPGGSRELEVEVPIPWEGAVTYEFDVLQNGVSSFGARGSPTAKICARAAGKKAD